MTCFRRTGLLAAALCSTALLAAACSEDGGPDSKQCKVVPAFRLNLRAASGPLPPDTMLEVKYGAGVESYRLDQGDTGQENVLCHTDAPDGGDAGKDVSQIDCELWTQGAAKVTLTATGYDTIVKDLGAKEDPDKCLETVTVTIILGDLDAGT